MRKNIDEDTDDAARELKLRFTKTIERAMKQQKVTQSELARRMRTSRAVVHRMLNTDDPGITLTTMMRAAIALQRTVRIRAVAA